MIAYHQRMSGAFLSWMVICFSGTFITGLFCGCSPSSSTEIPKRVKIMSASLETIENDVTIKDLLLKIGLSTDHIEVLDAVSERPDSFWMRFGIGYGEEITLEVQATPDLRKANSSLGLVNDRYDLLVIRAVFVRRTSVKQEDFDHDAIGDTHIPIGKPYKISR